MKLQEDVYKRQLLGTQTGTQTVVEENQQTSLMLSQGFIFVAVFLDFESFGKGTLQAVSYTHLGYGTPQKYK